MNPATAVMPATQQMNIRSYLGVPILLRDGRLFGTLCAVDTIPDVFRAEELQVMMNLARLLSYTLDLEMMVQQNQTELQFAQAVQQGVLIPAIQNEQVAIEPLYIPTAQVGGDMYAFYKVDEHRYGVFILDVMGKGVSASMVSMSIFSLLQGLITDVVDPVRVMEHLQQHMTNLYQNEYSDHVPTYFTAIYLVVDTQNKRIDYVNAGHPAGLLLDGQGRVVQLDSTSTPVGMFAEAEFEKATVSYAGGCRVLLYTDGLIELGQSMNQSVFSLQELMKEYRTLTARPFMEQLITAMFGETAMPDDVCMLTVDLLQ